MPVFLLSALAHHGEPGDPILLAWIKDQIDSVIGLGDLAIVVILGAVVVAIPIGILASYVMQRVKGAR